MVGGQQAGGDGVLGGRRAAVLGAALLVFARFGYRKASMDEVARAAGVSRQGLYFLFGSKQDLFEAAVSAALEQDVAAARAALAEPGRPLAARLVEAFDRWAGRYVGPLTADVAAVLDGTLGPSGQLVARQRREFADLVTAALTDAVDEARATVARQVARTLLSVSVGAKHGAATRAEYLDQLTVAVELLLLALLPAVAGPPGTRDSGAAGSATPAGDEDGAGEQREDGQRRQPPGRDAG